MSLVEVAIKIADHPATRVLLPVVADAWQKDHTQKRMELWREAHDRRLALLRQAYNPENIPNAGTTPAPEKQDDLYATGNDYSVGCLVCGRAHLASMAGMLDKASEISTQKGQCDIDCAYYVAAAQREVVNLLNYDWTPEQIAATPPDAQAVLHKWLPSLREAQSTLFVGPESSARLNLAKASGALEEAGRFARSGGVNHPEAQMRIADAEQWLTTTERAEWSPERRQAMDPAIRHIVDANLAPFRSQRQFLLNGIQTPEDLDRIAADVGIVNAKIQGIILQQLTPDQVQTMAQELQSMRDGFRADAARIGGEHTA